MNDTSKHPCFSAEARHLFGRIHLPVARRCNMQCNFCNRKYDCVNESHPGVASAVLTPPQALEYLADALRRRPEIAVVGLAGPGDPFANPDETMETLRSVRREFPRLVLCVATNGLAIGAHVEELARLQVSHATLTVNAISPETGAKIYAWIRDGKRPLRGAAAAALLIERQMDALRRLKACGISVKVNSVVIPGVNDAEIPQIAEAVAARGADVHNCMPMVPVEGAAFGDVPAPDEQLIARLRAVCGGFLPQMDHCTRCRADAAGLLSESASAGCRELRSWVDARSGDGARPFVAVASHEGALVNQHLGEAERVMIFQKHPGSSHSFTLKECRTAPPPGGGDDRWAALASLLHDCRALLVSSAGARPRSMLAARGLQVVEMEGLIEEGLDAIYSNRPIPAVMRREFSGCVRGAGCRGTGAGCG